MNLLFNRWSVLPAILMLFLLSLSQGEPRPMPKDIVLEQVPADCSLPVSRSWIEKVNRIRWVAYSSPNPDLNLRFYQPTADTVYQDLKVLRRAQFTGLITYGSAGIMGTQFPSIAQSLGFQGIIMGIWGPNNPVELKNVQAAGSLPIVLGYVMGNEGLSGKRDRYTLSDLCSAITDLRTRSGKPVATAEDVDTYDYRPGLLSVGDWLFPIAHPYWHATEEPQRAIQWEQDQYDALLEKSNRFVFFEENGLPTAGANGLSESNQDLFYSGLAKTRVRFAYFEAFDQPSKINSSVEPHWGIFHSNLKPKLLGWDLMGYRLFTAGNGSDFWVQECSGKRGVHCVINTDETFLMVGKGLGGKQYRSILAFDTSGLPEQAIITSVKLKLKMTGITGFNLANHQNKLILDSCTSRSREAALHPTMELDNGLACIDNVGSFEKGTNNGWYTADLHQDAIHAFDLKGVTRFRLRISNVENMRSERAYALFDRGISNGLNSPVLLVRYTFTHSK
jgi:exo-beta-1,3-glucanase (GH17 family)